MFYGDFTPEQKALLERMFAELPKMFGRCYFGDNNVILGRNLSYLDEPQFAGALDRQARDDQERSLAVRLNTLVWAFDNALHIDGDIVECGVFKGFSFAFLADYFDFARTGADRAKTLWLYDTFEGVPPAQNGAGHDSERFHEPGLHEGVLERFKTYPNVRVVRGALPGSLEGASPGKIALLHLDLNSAPAEIETLEVLFDRVVPGGIIVFDDYGWLAYAAQHRIEKAWARERGYRIFETANGQGVLLKR